MREHKQSRIILSLLLGFILLALCLPVCAFAEDAELSDGDEAGISLSTTIPPSIISGSGAVYEKGGTNGLHFTTDDTSGNFLRVLVDGKVVSPDNYTVSGEPLMITLHADFLDTLSAGEHTIEIVTTNGSATAKFAIAGETNISEKYTVRFNSNGHGTAPASQMVEKGKKATKPADPTASGYTFGGWFTDKECKSAYSFDTAVTKDITLYAKWTKNGSSSGGSSSSSSSGKTSAKTGDSSHAGAWAGLMAAAAACLVLTVITRRRIRR